NAANNGENEVKILSILEGTNRIYCVVKGSKVYLNATVEFTAGDDISAAGAAFSVKDAEGNALGSFTVSAASTIVAAAYSPPPRKRPACNRRAFYLPSLPI
ncbi:hypothetical protein MRZ76_02620, partial [bacterium]|nr:hypothetical protein [bacterium]